MGMFFFGCFCMYSCDPNCVTQKWIVGEVERVGFFALRDIAVGEELTFDYQMQTYGYGSDMEWSE